MDAKTRIQMRLRLWTARLCEFAGASSALSASTLHSFAKNVLS